MTETRGRWRVPAIVLSACLLLAVLGLLLMTLAFGYLNDPEGISCRAGATVIEDANENDDVWDDVELDGRDVDDLSCADATALAEQIPTEDDGDDTVVIPTASEIRTQGVVLLVIGLLQLGGAIATVWTARRIARTVAVVGASLGIVVQLFGIVSLIAVAFIIYALLFSGAARSLWGRGRPPRRAAPEGAEPADDPIIDTEGTEVTDTDGDWPEPDAHERRNDETD
ncbi:MAG: hypothetical protein JJE52_07425 [Acidimicrobiia bacterium]|nr:hypothetical protein [Acidimicrobiia bacterium]